MSKLEPWVCAECSHALPAPVPSTAPELNDAVEISQPFKTTHGDIEGPSLEQRRPVEQMAGAQRMPQACRH